MKIKFIRFLKFCSILSVGVLIYILGILTYKNEASRTKLNEIIRLKDYNYSNYSTGRDSNPREIQLIISDSSKQVIEHGREKAIAAGILRDENKTEVPGKLIYKGDTLQIELRLKGDYPDHWSGNKWSYRIKIKGDKRLFGMQSFSLQAPETRKGLNEWYYHKLLKREGLIALRYGFISLSENGKEKGVYAIEESFDKELIESNDRRYSPILKFDESILIDEAILNWNNAFSQTDLFYMADISVFKSKSTLKDSILYDQYQKGFALLEGFRNGSISCAEAFDVDKASKLFAISDLTGGHHALRWKNVRFYYNPVIAKLELIGFDSNSGNTITSIYYNLWRDNHVGEYDVYAWKDLFFKDSSFTQMYFTHLKRFSSPQYLSQFHTEISYELEQNLSYLYKDEPRYHFNLSYYTQNASIISNCITEFEESLIAPKSDYLIKAQTNRPPSIGDTKLEILFSNLGLEEITVLGIFNKKKEKRSIDNSFTLTPRIRNQATKGKTIQEFSLLFPLDSTHIRTKRKGAKYKFKHLKIGFQFPGQLDTNFIKIEQSFTHNSPNEKFTDIKNLSFIEIDNTTKIIRIKEGTWTIDQTLTTPQGYTVLCGPNTQLHLVNNARLIFNGNLLFEGSIEHPILINSPDSSGSFLVYQTQKQSHLSYVIFDHLSESHIGRYHLTGAVNFYEAPVILNEITFSNNNSEDALNIFASTFELSNSKFTRTKSDAFDGDFARGKVRNVQFINIGNDALDFSGSRIELFEISMDGISDKGISAGEMSRVIGENIKISNAELGLVSKDLSFLKIKEVTLSDCKVPLTVFCKKEMFGHAYAEIEGYQATNFIEEFIIEISSEAFINNHKIKGNKENVSEVFYGNQYGKSSK